MKFSLRDAIPEYKWSKEMPKTIGLWEIRCFENGKMPERVAITNRGANLWVHSSEVGTNPVKHFHDGLSELEWRKLA